MNSTKLSDDNGKTDEGDRELDELKVMFEFGISMVSTMNELVIAVVLGIFGVLALLNGTVLFTGKWIGLSVVYFAIGIVGAWCYARNLAYGQLVSEILGFDEDIEKKTKKLVSPKMLELYYFAARKALPRWLAYFMFGKKNRRVFSKYRRNKNVWIPVGFIGLLLAYVVVAFQI